MNVNFVKYSIKIDNLVAFVIMFVIDYPEYTRPFKQYEAENKSFMLQFLCLCLLAT